MWLAYLPTSFSAVTPPHPSSSHPRHLRPCFQLVVLIILPVSEAKCYLVPVDICDVFWRNKLLLRLKGITLHWWDFLVRKRVRSNLPTALNQQLLTLLPGPWCPHSGHCSITTLCTTPPSVSIAPTSPVSIKMVLLGRYQSLSLTTKKLGMELLQL